jgi:hypothetical protein
MADAIIAICESGSNPFKKNKSSDDLEFVPLLPVFLNTLRYFFLAI